MNFEGAYLRNGLADSVLIWNWGCPTLREFVQKNSFASVWEVMCENGCIDRRYMCVKQYTKYLYCLLHVSNKSWQSQIQNSVIASLIVILLTLLFLFLCSWLGMLSHSAAQYERHYTKNQSHFDVAACLQAFSRTYKP